MISNVRNLRLNLHRIRAYERQVLCRSNEEVFQVLLVLKKWLQACYCDIDIVITVRCLDEYVRPGDCTQEVADSVLKIWDGVEWS